ncbi:MAG: glycosyltransferase [Deltaproteobacteria bacterium]|nr:glycosyltransferase [Deltaproteobacteria bacterium]HDM10802.1 hypothetical protein [Desulfobacteraceae bacterium]
MRWKYKALKRIVSEHPLYIRSRRGLHELSDRLRRRESLSATLSSQSIGMIITEASPNTIYGDYFAAKGLGDQMEKLGYQVIYIPERPVYLWHRIPENLTILISLIHTFDPRPAKKLSNALTVAWIRGYVPQWCEKPWFDHYDLVIATSDIALEYAAKFTHPNKCAGILRLAADPEIFRPGPPVPKYESDLCFVGNIFDVERQLVNHLSIPSGLTFKYYGRLTDGKSWLARYHQGPIAHNKIPKVYNSSKLVLEDCTPMCKPWGCINSRTFEALSCGACLVSNDVPGLEQLFGSLVTIYRNRDDLSRIIKDLVSDVEKRSATGKKAREKILEAHTFRHRAMELKRILANHV